MVKDDFWSKPRDDFDNLEALANQKKIPIANKADVAQSLQMPEKKDKISPILSSVIPKTALSGPIIYEDIWGDDVKELGVTETTFSPDQALNTEGEASREWTENNERLSEQYDDTLALMESDNEIPVSPIIPLRRRHLVLSQRSCDG